MAGTGWDIAVPADGDNVSAGAGEIRTLKEEIETRLNKEHVDFAGSSVGGEHVAGSAMCYYQGASPTTDPAGNALDTSGSTDTGRLHWDTDFNYLYAWDGTDFLTELAYVHLGGTSQSITTGNGISINNNGTGVGISLDVGGSSNGKAIAVTQSGTNTSSDLVTVTTLASSATNGILVTMGASSTGTGISINMSSTSIAAIKLSGLNGPAINLNTTSHTGTAANDIWSDGTNLHFSDGSTNWDIPNSVGSTGSNTTANGTVAVDIGGTTYYLLKAASAS